MHIWKKVDSFFGKMASWLFVIMIVIILLAFAHKAIIGQFMMYEDYYNKKIQSEQPK